MDIIPKKNNETCKCSEKAKFFKKEEKQPSFASASLHNEQGQMMCVLTQVLSQLYQINLSFTQWRGSFTVCMCSFALNMV